MSAVFLLRRLILAVPTLFGVTVIVFVLLRVVPGDPINMMIGPGATPQDIQALREIYGLDKSIYDQFVIYLRDLAHGHFGTSISLRQDVLLLILGRLPVTIELCVVAMLGAVAAGDIGTFFPPSDPRWRGADSRVFVEEALEQIRHAGYRIVNLDSTLILATPKIAPIAKKIQQSVADLLNIEPNCVGIKAKTPEGMGTDNAAIAHVAVLLEEVR